MPFIKVKDIELHYAELGERRNKTIFFVHPMLWTSETFSDLLNKLAADFHIVAVDVHGHGRSGWRDEMTLEEMTEDFVSLLDELELSKVIWFGISIGGMTGMRFAAQFPERIEQLVLMSTTARTDPPELRDATLKLWEMFRDGHRADIAAPAMDYFFSAKTRKENPQMVSEYQQKLENWGNIGGMFEASLAAFNRRDIGEKIKDINAPTLIINGSDDPSTPPKEAEFIAAQIPNAEAKIIANANHLLAVEKTREVYRIIDDFLKNNV